MYINELMLEITRRCNLECPHCLRGDAERKEMSRELLLRIFSDIDNVGTLTLTGGEPFMALDVIEDIFTVLDSKDINIQTIWICTNGRKFNSKIKKIINRFEYYADEVYVKISTDKFHPRKYNGKFEHWLLNKQERCENFYTGHHGPGTRGEFGLSNPTLLALGRATVTHPSRLEPMTYNMIDRIMDDDDNIYWADLLYVNTYGDMFSECDLSFNIQRNYPVFRLGNMLTPESLEFKLRRGYKNFSRKFRDRSFKLMEEYSGNVLVDNKWIKANTSDLIFID